MRKEKLTTDNTNSVDKANIITLPVLTLRGLVIFPTSTVQIVIARSKSKEAIEQASALKDMQIVVFTQKDESKNNPEQNDIYQCGTLCKILSKQVQENKNIVCYLKGLRRVKLEELVDKKTYKEAKFIYLQDITAKKKDNLEYKEVLSNCLDRAVANSSDIVKNILEKNVSKDIIERIKQETSLATMTDKLAQILSLELFDRQMLLEEVSSVQRANILLCHLNDMTYKQEVMNKIIESARASMDKHQKDYYLSEQLKAIKRELNIDNDGQNDIELYKKRLETEDLPLAVKNKLRLEINKLNANVNNTESSIIRNYVDTLFNIPWNKKSDISKDLNHAQEILEQEHYGLSKVKDRILEYLAVQARQEKLHGPIMCLMGPPGIGKTSLGASIAKATGRKYVRIALGGLHDESEIRGHRRTYIGALPGKIIQQLIKCGVNNPLFLLDEIDKVSNSNHGDPASALLEVLDPEQNKAFLDNYVDLDFDLSNVMFIATANSYNIEKPLLDRMEVIDLSSYTEDEKFHIAKEHLIAKQMRENNLNDKEFSITDEAINELIIYYTHEAGVRGLERLINELCRKSVKSLMISKAKTKRKIVIDVKAVAKHLGPRRYDFTSKLNENKVGIVNGLAYTSLGGDILQLEAVALEGNGKRIVTGKLGEVMKESISAAMTVVRSLADKLDLDKGFSSYLDIHVHVPEGATPKEGPSAGIGMCTAIVSAITGNKVRADVAMTGEITLRGDVLPIGGLKEKLLAALRGGIKTAIIPYENEKDLYDIPKNVKDKLEIIPVKTILEVLKIAFVEDPFSFKACTEFSKEAALKRKNSKANSTKKADKSE